MKRLIFAFICLICGFSFTSCATVNVNIDFSNNISEIESVEIYNLEKQYTTQAEARRLREENEPVYILENEQIESFVCEISSLDFSEERIYFPAPVDWVHLYSGYVVSVVYNDGSYDIVAANGQLSFENKGNGKYGYGHADYCGEEPWDDIIKGYIQK